MPGLIALRGVRNAHKNVAHLQQRQHVIHRNRSRVVELLLGLLLENKQHIMPNNVENQHKHTYSLFINCLCNIAFPMARFACIVTSQVFVKS